jgi:hypothetical protein
MINLFKYRIYIFLSLIIIVTFNNAIAYTMPVGIPETTLDFEKVAPSRPSNWNDEIPGYYYIDFDNGTYAAEFGSETSPRKKIPTVIPAGSYVEIAGEYNVSSGGVVPIYAKGTNEDWVANKSGPVWITGSKNKPSAFTTRKVILWGDNVFFTGITLKEGSKLQVGSFATGYAASNIVVKNNEIIGTIEMKGGSLLSALGNEESKSENIVFFDNIIRDAGDINSTLDLDAGLIEISGYSSNVWVLDNTGYNASGSGLQLNTRPPRTATHNIYAGNNEFYNVRQSGLIVKYVTNVVFSTNYIHDIISTSWSPSKGIAGQYEPDGLWIINNHIQNVEYGIRIPSTNDVGDTLLKIYIIGNLIYNVNTLNEVGTNSAWESAAIHLHGAHERYVYNNLIFNAPNGINISTYKGQTFIKNNIIYDLSADHPNNETGFSIWSEGQRSNDEILIDNNYFGSNMKVKLIKEVYETAALLNTTNNINNIMGPDLVSSEDIKSIIENGDADGILSSVVVDKGVNVNNTLLTTFRSIFPDTTGLDRDILNNSRNLGVSIDIGPFEQNGEEIMNTVPTSPTDVKLFQLSN